ncbi:MAG: NrfD/PsrC family molybdoenzyme membrane anchor subunit [Chloroflexota bacterium]
MDHQAFGKHAPLFAPLLRTSRRYYLAVVVLGLIVAWGAGAYIYQFTAGLGVTGLSLPVPWGVHIINFIFFIAVGFGGTLTSAVLRIFNAGWRTPITRAAELLTVCGLIFGTLNVVFALAKPQRILNLVFYPHPQSPLIWDVVAIGSYILLSLVYLYLPMIPDIATLRDSFPRRKRLYEFLALGWTGSASQKKRLERLIDILTVMMLPTAVAVHSVLAWIFGMTLRPGWHSTIFGPYFIMGAMFSGIGALLVVMAVLRRALHLENYLKPLHFNNMGILLLIMSFAWLYFTIAEYLTVFYGNEHAEMTVLWAKFNGEFAPYFWLQVITCFVIPFGLLISRRTRTITGTVIAGASVVIGMWLERFVIIVPTLARPFLPYPRPTYTPNWVEWSVMAGCTAAIILVFVVFAKFFPLVSVWELEEHEQ